MRRFALSLTFFLFLISNALGTPEFSVQTGKSCAHCHSAAGGGGTLTSAGEQFKSAGFKEVPGTAVAVVAPSVLFRLIVGYLHILVAFIWVGVIFYVHIFIGAESFPRGLPKREVLVGRVSILLMLTTGIILSIYRFHSYHEISSTTFGIVWSVKVSLFLAMLVVAAYVTTKLDRQMHEAANDDEPTLPDGKEGRPAHFVFEGKLYDATKSKMWKNGNHMRAHQAGCDLTEALAAAPHGTEVLERIECLGDAPELAESPPSEPAKLFVRLAYFNLAAICLILLCVVYWRYGPPLMPPPPPGPMVSVSSPNQHCIDCHIEKGVQPVQIQEWRKSRHARAGVGCYQCHRAQKGDVDGFDHNGYFISTIVSPKDCERCHPKQVHQFVNSRHAKGGDILASLDNFLGEVVEGVPAAVGGCQQCHGAKVEVLKDGRLSPTCWPNTGIGRINPDGSRGACSACHPRHRFAVSVARRPESCGRCHMGPDHPQFEIYKESKHGTAFADAGDEMNLRAQMWRLGKEYSAAPGCTSCHNGANRRLEATHDVGLRLAWTLRPEVSIKQEQWKERRERMTITCQECHSKQWVNNFFTQFDNAVELYNDKFAQPAKAVMEKLRKAKLLTPTQFDEKIEWTYFLLWHHEGRRARHGAAMMGPDYTQWHGFFEVAERFYQEFIPEAEHLMPGVTKFIDELDYHKWRQGVPDAMRKQMEEYYRKRYGKRGDQ